MRETLPKALALMFGHEGGYSNVKTDSGGPTKFGITHKTLAAHRGVKSVTAEQVKAMTIDEATEIYRQSYWAQSGGDLLPVGLDYAAFDFGVNSGPARAVKVLQGVLGVAQDGNAGTLTIAAVNKFPGGLEKLIKAFCAARMDYLRGLKDPKTGFPVNGRGWTIRVTGIDPKGLYAPAPGVIGNALAMVSHGVVEPTIPAPVGGDAKAVPSAPNPWTKPEVVLPGAGAILTPALLSGSGPVQFAVGFAIVALVIVGVFFAFKRISRTVA